ncbi:MAG: triose-phosphate isomerase [Chitinophagales bacterium]
MRKNIIAGNWKMNKSPVESTQLVEETLRLLSSENIGETVVIFCPPFISLERVASLVKENKNVFVAAQNCHWEKSGAFTGEVSAAMIKATGATYVIIGHSERRLYFQETNEQLAKKATAIIGEGMQVIYCCGEPLEIREANAHFTLVEQQIREGLFHLTKENFASVVIAYEPVWAIGTGKVASDEQAQQMHAFIRGLIRKQYDEETANNLTIQYGGSMKPSNAKGLMTQTDVDGGLIGGASLIAADFVGIIKSV